MLVSVIIPFYNRYLLLQRCLQGLRQQRFADFEIILVDDGSTEAMPSYLQTQYLHWHRLNYIRLSQNQGRSAARNQGLLLAKAPLILFLDSDMFVEPDFIYQHWYWHQSKGAGWIGQGKIIGTPDFIQQAPASLWTDASRAQFATGNVSVSRQALMDTGGFDTEFSAYGFEDLELGFRLKQAGQRFDTVHKAVSWHYEPPLSELNWQEDIAKERARGHGAALFYQKHPCLEVRLIAQLTPLHPLLDQFLRFGGLITEARWQHYLPTLYAKHPKLALAIYRGLLNRYCSQATRNSLQNKSP